MDKRNLIVACPFCDNDQKIDITLYNPEILIGLYSLCSECGNTFGLDIEVSYHLEVFDPKLP